MLCLFLKILNILNIPSIGPYNPKKYLFHLLSPFLIKLFWLFQIFRMPKAILEIQGNSYYFSKIKLIYIGLNV